MRVHGFDFLRGAAAIFVALYHILYWRGTADLNNLGIVSVCIFFSLSGASIYLAYEGKLGKTMAVSEFLGRRFFRIAPLFWLLLLIVGHALGSKLYQTLLNGSFLFAFANPGKTSILTGGWSLGIEFIFYLAFPFFLPILGRKYWPYIIFGFVLLVQQAYVATVIKSSGDMAANWPQYVQFVSFIAYFWGGCLIGKAVKDGITIPFSWAIFPLSLGVWIWLCVASNDFTMSGPSGAVFVILSLIVVMSSASLRVPGMLAALMGNMSYGVYLLHPYVYKKSLQVLGFKPFEVLGEEVACAGVIMGSIVSALLVYRYFENPVRQWGYRKLATATC